MRHLLHPRWVMSAYWVVVLTACLTLYPTSSLNATAVWIIVLFVGAFTYGVIFATLKKPYAVEAEHAPVQLNPRIIRLTAIVGAACNIAAIVLAVRTTGRSFADVLSLAGLLEVGNASAVARYVLREGNSAIALLAGLGYVAAAVAPFMLATAAKRKTIYIALPALTSLLYASVTTARLGFLVAVALTLGGLIAAATLKNGKAPVVNLKLLTLGVLSAALVAFAFVGIAQVRAGNISEDAINRTLDKQIVYSLGGPPAFSTWYDQYGSSDTPLGFGTASIAGMEYLTGQDRHATRSYDDYVVIDQAEHSTNVFTAFRGLVLDFGTAGTLVVMALSGAAFGITYRKAVAGSAVAASWLGYGYAVIALSPWLAITTFTNVLAVAFVAPIILAATRRTGTLKHPLRSSSTQPSDRCRSRSTSDTRLGSRGAH